MITEIKKSLVELPPFKKVVVGVSGGADSVALVHILNELGYSVIMAHLNHSLRGAESDEDQKFVDRLSKKWKLPLATETVTVPTKGNLEQSARLIRYAFLEKVRQDHKADFIAVAHHRDDQIETVLMHLKRGAGWRGIRGMQSRKGNVIRPLLAMSKEELLHYLKKNKIKHREDLTNRDEQFQRNRLRHRIIPALKKDWKHLEQDVLALSEMAKRKMEMIERVAKDWTEAHVRDEKFKRADFLELPDDMQSEVLFLIGGYRDVYRPSIQKAKAIILKGMTGKQFQLGSRHLKVQYETITFGDTQTTIPPRKLTLKLKEIRWGSWTLNYSGAEKLFVRSWKPGDRFRPNGLNGSKKLQDLFVDLKIPQSERHQIPLVVNENDEILTVADFRLADIGVHLKQCLTISKAK